MLRYEFPKEALYIVCVDTKPARRVLTHTKFSEGIAKLSPQHQITYKLGSIKHGSTAFKVQKDGCGIPSAARVLLGTEGL